MKSIRLCEVDDGSQKKLIKVSLPTQSLFLKAPTSSEHIVWYNNIYATTVHARANSRLEDMRKVTVRTEQRNAEMDKRTLLSLFSGVEGILKVKEARNLLFEKLKGQKSEYRYLSSLYTAVVKYKEFCEYEQYEYAFVELKKVCKMVNTLTVDEGVEEEKLASKNLREIVKEILPLSTKLLLNNVANRKEAGSMKKEFFNDVEAKIASAFNRIYQDEFTHNSFDGAKDELARIPLLGYRRSFHYVPTLRFLADLFAAKPASAVAGTAQPLEIAVSPLSRSVVVSSASANDSVVSMMDTGKSVVV